MSNFQKFLKIF